MYGQTGLMVDKPTSSIIGENGAEAVVPLEGSNRKYGKSILQKIIPKYFPDLAFMQTGGIVGGTAGGITKLIPEGLMEIYKKLCQI